MPPHSDPTFEADPAPRSGFTWLMPGASWKEGHASRGPIRRCASSSSRSSRPGAPNSYVGRFIALWEAYWAGPGEQDASDQADAWLFGTWFASRLLPEKWTLQQLAAFVDVVPVPEPDHAVAERLAEIAPVDILGAVGILDKMIHGDRQRWQVHM